MKKSIIIAAISAASALLLVSSCAKEALRENVNTGDGKVFTAVISQNLTKTTITSEYKVNWEAGDQININGAIFSATPDASDATKATFTKVSGSDPAPEYTAVYPASIMVATQATLPATQTYAAGKFNAPMCAMSSTESLEFKNFCGVLCFALKGTDKVKSIAVTANEQLCGPFEFSTDATFGCFSGENEGHTVTLDCGEGVQLDASTATSFYISLPPATYTAGMKIVVTSTEGKTFEKTTTKSAAIAGNQIYTFNWTASFSPAEPDCVEIGGIKWATKNLGAEKETDYGYYFAWGATELAYSSLSSKTFTFVASRPASYGGSGWTQSSGFAKVNAPYYDGSAYTKYTKSDSKIVLESGDDAATALLGSGWRMPTSQEFADLADACGGSSSYNTSKNPGKDTSVGKGIYWCTNYDGVAGCLFCDGTNKLFFPAAGYGDGTSRSLGGSSGCYWSSSLNTSNADSAFGLGFYSSIVYPQYGDYRPNGFSVRPVKDAAALLPAGALAGVFSVSATKKVRFSKGNLYWDGDSFELETNQYDVQSSWSTSHVGHFFWSKDASVAYAASYSESGTATTDVFFTNDPTDAEKAKADFTVNGVTGEYRTLSKDEFIYLFSRTSKHGFATVGGVYGIIILPDTFTDPMKNGGSGAFKPLPTQGYDKNVYTIGGNWEAMESAGAVFLPATNFRKGTKFDQYSSGSGFYWSSVVKNASRVYGVTFNDGTVYPYNSDHERNYGKSVRLVTDVK